MRKKMKLLNSMLAGGIIAMCTAPLPAHAAPIQPDALSGLSLWLKADNIVDGAEPAPGTPVNSWFDSSGNAKHAIVAAGSNAPTLANVFSPSATGNLNYSSVNFSNSVNDLLVATDVFDTASPFSNFTIITVYQTNVDSNQVRPVGFGSQPKGDTADNFNLAGDTTIRKDNGFVGTASTLQPNNLFIRSATMAPGSVNQYFNGVDAMTSTASFNVASDNLYLGDIRFTPSDNISIAEVIVYNSVLSSTDREGVEEYLTGKYLEFPARNNLALTGTASQSSTFNNNPGLYGADKANDGLFNAALSHTAPDTNLPATWELLLDQTSAMDEIVIHNRTGCCLSRLRDITVQVLDDDGLLVFESDLLNPENILGNSTVDLGPQFLELDLVTLTGDLVVGRTVRIIRTPDPDQSGIGSPQSGFGISEADTLALSEVQIFGNVVPEPSTLALLMLAALTGIRRTSTLST